MVPQIYLSFDGRCEAAFRFYEERLGAVRGAMFPYGHSPMAGMAPEDWIMHGSITLGGITLLGADLLPAQYEPPKGMRIFLEVDEADAAERLFTALAEDGIIEMPLQETFWSVRFGVLTDQFGIPWTISCAEVPPSADVSRALN